MEFEATTVSKNKNSTEKSSLAEAIDLTDMEEGSELTSNEQTDKEEIHHWVRKNSFG